VGNAHELGRCEELARKQMQARKNEYTHTHAHNAPPSEEIATSLHELKQNIVLMAKPRLRSQSLIVRSYEPDTTRLLSALNRAAATLPTCASEA
jgi:hypothetical protein